MSYVIKTRIGCYVQQQPGDPFQYRIVRSQREATKFESRTRLDRLVASKPVGRWRVIKLVPKATPMPVASPVAPVPDVLQVLTVHRQGRDFIGARVASELVRLHIDASQVVSVVPLLSQVFGGNEHETRTVQVLYRRK